jgi:arylsulfatase A-like enzyme
MVRDLIADLDLAEVQREPGLVDLGTPGARALLRKGWWLDEGRAGQTFVWSDGPESELAFFLARSRDIPLTLRWVPYTEPRKPAQTVTLVLNGETVGQVTAAAGRNEARMVLPGNHLQAGENHLVLRYAWTRAAWSGSGEISGRHRPAVAWDFFRFETGVDEQSQLRAIGDRLALPFGWRMNFYLRLPARAVLTMDGLHLHGGQRGELRVTLRPAGGVEQELGRLHTGSGPSALKLPDEGDLPVQLSLIAVPERTAGPSGSFILRRPAIFASTGARPGLARALPAALRQAHPGARPRNVIIYLVDTLRAGHLGCYGYSRPVSPHIDAFAREAALFRHTVAQSSWTRPSTTTILTGLLPKTHDVFGHRDALPPQAVTLAERLQVRGYHTAAFVTNPNVAPDFGLDQGFEIYRLMGKKHRAATDVNRRAADWLDNEWKKDAPFFLYLHTMEPHAPYSAPLAFRQRFAPGVHESWMTMDILEQLEDGDLKATPGMRQSLTDLYDAEIAANDEAFGALIDLLVQRGLWDDTVVVFVSDHGEELADHGGWEHGKTLHNEMLDVPLIVRVPGAAGRVVERQAQQVDVVPTILEALGLQIPPGLEGRSLLASDDGTNPQDRPAYSWLEEISLRSAAVTTPEWRLIEKRFPIPGSFLYDRRADPGELRNLAGERPVRAGYLRAQLRAAERSRQGMLQARETTLDNDMQTQLKALGYLR